MKSSRGIVSHWGLRCVLAPAGRHVIRFRDDESGTFIVFGLIIFVLMLAMSGMAVDVMRYEAMRSRIQNTLDTATLAAANLDQTLDPTAVVNDYFAKAGLSQYLGDVSVTESLNARTVTADASVTVPSLFMQLAGVNSLTAPGSSTAAESIGNVEVSLVLDVSGSMGQNHKIDNLRVAAKNFVDQMFDQVEPGKLSISIVPYAAQVTAGPELFGYYNTSADHDYSYCVDFDSTDYETAALPTTEPLEQAGNFDPWYNTTDIDRRGLRVCPKESSRYILPFSGDRDALKADINGLQAEGSTSIDVGMKWGAALVDPSSEPIVTAMIANGTRPEGFDGRPYAYTDHDSMKVIVVMTDGENTSRPVLQSPYKSGASRVWSNSNDSNNYSFYDAGRNQYYWTIDDNWHSGPYGTGGGSYQTCTDWGWYYGWYCSNTNASGTPVQMTWQQVWEKMSIDWFTRNIIRPAYGNNAANTWTNNLVDWMTAQGTWSDTQDTNLLNVCDAAKANRVTIYSIGFMATNAGKSVLRQCATTPAYFYDVATSDISAAFSSIANSINKLRLTQ